MEPKLRDGSFFMALSIPTFFVKPKVGDRILFKDGRKNVVKRVSEIKGEKYTVVGDNTADSKKYPPIEREKILGKVVVVF